MTGRAHFRHSPEARSILHLQSTIVTQVLQRMLQSHVEEPIVGSTDTASPRFGHDFSRISIHTSVPRTVQTTQTRIGYDVSGSAESRRSPAWQIASGPTYTPSGGIPAEAGARKTFTSNMTATSPNLSVGAVDDPLEHEADRVAEEVIRTPAAAVSVAAVPPQVRRACAECEEEEKLQKKPAGLAHSAAAGGEAPATVRDVVRSSGQPLDAATRTYFEPRFGHDFGHVRVHAGPQAEQSARDVNAHAYTVGRNLVFGAGQFAPATQTGRRLIAHELAHVLQQSRLEGLADDVSVQRACLPASECATPPGEARAGSAKQFGEEMAEQEAPKQAAKRAQTPQAAQAGGHGRRAVEVEKLFQQHLPQLRPMVHGVFVDDTLPPDAAAGLVNCLAWAQRALPAAADKTEFEGAVHRCIRIPKALEDQAAAYNQAASPRLSDAQHVARREWLNWHIVRAMTHEVTHERFLAAKLTFPSSGTCTRDAVASDLSELAAAISEFPVVEGLESTLREPWAKHYLTDPRLDPTIGESIFGAIREIRCSCECGAADTLIREAFGVASAHWTEDQRIAFHAYMKRGKGAKFGAYWPFELPPRVGELGSHELSLDLGIGFSGSNELAVAMLTYRYVLSQWAGGRLRLTTGAQANPGALSASLLNFSPPGEFGAGIVGLQFVSTPKAVEKWFGGITGRLDTGLGVGEFSLQPAAPGGAQTTGVRADYILRVGAGVQFFIPGLTSLRPVSLEAAYGLAQPLDSEATRIHTFGLRLSTPL